MNHFLALRLTPDTRDRLGAVSERLQRWGLPAAWVHPDDLHITVLFLGHLDDQEAHLIPTLAEPCAACLRRPQLKLSGMGAFGGRSAPQVVYAAVTDAERACHGMHQDLAELLEVTAERDFFPHVTVCRPRAASQRDLREAAPNASWPQLLEAHGLADWGSCDTEALVFYRSEQFSPTGLRYHELASWPLIEA